MCLVGVKTLGTNPNKLQKRKKINNVLKNLFVPSLPVFKAIENCCLRFSKKDFLISLNREGKIQKE